MPCLSGNAIGFERNKGHRVVINDCLQVVARQVGFVGAHLAHGEVARRGLNQPLELRTVISVCVRNLNTGNDVGLYSTHQVDLNPLVLFQQFRIGVFGISSIERTAIQKLLHLSRTSPPAPILAEKLASDYNAINLEADC